MTIVTPCNKTGWLMQAQVRTVIGFVEDECSFNTLSWMKNKFRSRLGEHLDFAVYLYAQPFWTRDSFPYATAYDEWKSSRDKRGAL